MTVRQQQCLLNYLGYDTGGLDGISGEKTKAALLAAGVAPGEDPGPALLKAVLENPVKKDFWEDIRHFSRTEFACRCGSCGGFPAEPVEKLVRMAEKVRGHFGVPVRISSGVRCRKHNAAVGGVGNSRHLLGWAADLTAEGISAETLDAYAASLPECAYHYKIDGSYVHIDVVL